jgi:hypothetical protein
LLRSYGRPRYSLVTRRFRTTLSRIDEFTGYYTVVDPIAAQVRDNEAVRELRNYPVAMSLLAEPRVNEILTGSRLRDALADEAVLHLLADQATLVQAVRSPQNLRGVVPDGFFQLLADPVVQSLLTNPRILCPLSPTRRPWRWLWTPACRR